MTLLCCGDRCCPNSPRLMWQELSSCKNWEQLCRHDILRTCSAFSKLLTGGNPANPTMLCDLFRRVSPIAAVSVPSMR